VHSLGTDFFDKKVLLNEDISKRRRTIKIINDLKLLGLRESNKRAHNRCYKRWAGEGEEAQ